jgi:hypothetical protein
MEFKNTKLSETIMNVYNKQYRDAYPITQDFKAQQQQPRVVISHRAIIFSWGKTLFYITSAR